MASFDYKRYFADNFKIVDKQAKLVPFMVNPVQEKFLAESKTQNIILKARQQGFSTIIDARIAVKFLHKENYRAVIIAHRKEDAAGLLSRLKQFIASYEEKTGVEVPKDRDSVQELHNSMINSMILIGTAQNVDVGRSRTFDEAHLSEYAFYPDGQRILTSVAQAVVPGGILNIETTANGFNFFKTLWDASVLGETPYQPMFFKASQFYDAPFLEVKKKELGRYFTQEYPETPEEAFLTSGETYFDKSALAYYLENTKETLEIGNYTKRANAN